MKQGTYINDRSPETNALSTRLTTREAPAAFMAGKKAEWSERPNSESGEGTAVLLCNDVSRGEVIPFKDGGRFLGVSYGSASPVRQVFESLGEARTWVENQANLDRTPLSRNEISDLHKSVDSLDEAATLTGSSAGASPVLYFKVRKNSVKNVQKMLDYHEAQLEDVVFNGFSVTGVVIGNPSLNGPRLKDQLSEGNPKQSEAPADHSTPDPITFEPETGAA